MKTILLHDDCVLNINKKIEKLKIKLEKEEEKISKSIKNINWGYGCRAYSRIKKLNFSKIDSIKEQIIELNKLLIN
jgi:hypothetical protein